MRETEQGFHLGQASPPIHLRSSRSISFGMVAESRRLKLSLEGTRNLPMADGPLPDVEHALQGKVGGIPVPREVAHSLEVTKA